MAEYTKRSSGGFGGDRGGAGGGRGGFGGKPRFGGGGFGGGKHRFGGGGDRGGRGGFGGGRPSFGGDRAPREMFSATCATCQKPCEVPFRPNGEKPVYCLDCFRAQNGEGGEGNGAGSGATFNRETRPARFERNDRGDRNGRNDRPSYDKHAHAAAPLNDKRIDAIKAELEIVNSKLDRLMRMMSAAVKGEVIETSKFETKPVFSPAVAATISNSAVISEAKSPAHTKESKVAKEVKKKGKSKK